MKRYTFVEKMVKVMVALMTAAVVIGCSNANDPAEPAEQQFDSGLVSSFDSADWKKNGDVNANFTLNGNKAVVTVKNVGTHDYDVQLMQKVAVKNATSYKVTFDVTSTSARTIKYCLITSNVYDWQGGEDVVLEAGVKKSISYTITTKADFGGNDVNFQFSLGKIDGVDTPTGTITIENLALKEVTQ